MRLVALVGAICAAVTQGCHVNIDVASEGRALLARSRQLAAAESARRIDTALTLWADDAVVQPPGGPQIRGRAAIGDLYRHFFEGGALREFSSTSSYIEVARGGDIGYEFGTSRVILSGPEGDLLDAGKYLAVWKKVNGTWMVAALSFTSDTPAPVPYEPE
jgi:ketosteroid isomerase-like protein